MPLQQARRIAGQEATGRAADKAWVGVNLLHEQQRSLVGFARATAQRLGETASPGAADELALDTFIARLSRS